jgi:transposase
VAGLKHTRITGFGFTETELVVAVEPAKRSSYCGSCGNALRATTGVYAGGVIWTPAGSWCSSSTRSAEWTAAVCGVTTEWVPWAEGDTGFIGPFEDKVAHLAQRTDKTTVTRLMRIAWATVGRIVERVVARLGEERTAQLETVTMDMSKAYKTAVMKRAPNARIVFDRLHVQRLAHDALDKVRREQWRAADTEDKTAIRGTRFALQNNPWNLEQGEHEKLAAVQRTNKGFYRAYLLKETLRDILDRRQPNVAREKLVDWMTSRSRLRAFRKLTRTITRRAFGLHGASSLIALIFLLCSGHDKYERRMFPPEKVARRVVCRPPRCRGCGGRLSGDDPNPTLHQVAELPKVEPIVTEYVLHRLACRCGKTTCATLPSGVPAGAFGPTIIATVALLLGAYEMSRRNVSDFMRVMFAVPMSTGAVVGCQKIASSALKVPVQEASAFAREQPLKYADESGWKEGDVYRCLWTLVTATVTVFRIHAERSRKAAREVLGKVKGLLVSDRYSVYDDWPTHQHQFCWAHLTRLFRKLSERRGPVAAVGAALLEKKDAVFALYHRVRDGTLARSTFQRHMRPLQKEIIDLLDEGARSSCAKTSRTCTRLLVSQHALFAFVYHPELEPTDNVAERALRHAVILRKLWFGTQSSHGSRFLERVLTVYATLRQQKRDVHAFVVDACRAFFTRELPPSLLPTSPRA